MLLALAATSFVAWAVGLVLELGALLAGFDEQTRNLVGGLLLLVVPLVAAVALGVALVVNGVTMLRRERRSPANMLSLLAGVAVLGVIVLGALAVSTGQFELAAVLLLLMAPVAYLGPAFVAFLGWSLVYARLARRAPAPAAVVVLGSGLVQGRVPPLLLSVWRSASTLAEGRDAGARALRRPGGRTSRVARGKRWPSTRERSAAPAERMLVESASTTTGANLRLSQKLLAESGIEGPLLAVTNDYHAFRAATLLRKLGITGHAIGARTAHYYLPSALLREFIALLREHAVLNAIAFGVLMLPFVVYVVFALGRLMGGT